MSDMSVTLLPPAAALIPTSAQAGPQNSQLLLRYAVTLEFDLATPLVARGEIHVPNARLGARRAVEAAFRAHPNQNWRSLVMLLEKGA